MLSISQRVSRGPEPKSFFCLRLILFSPGPAWHGPCRPPRTQLTSHCHQPWLPYYSSDKPALSCPWACFLAVFPHLGTSVSLDLSIQVTTSKRPSLITLKQHLPVTLRLIPQLHAFTAQPSHLGLILSLSLRQFRDCVHCWPLSTWHIALSSAWGS